MDRDERKTPRHPEPVGQYAAEVVESRRLVAEALLSLARSREMIRAARATLEVDRAYIARVHATIQASRLLLQRRVRILAGDGSPQDPGGSPDRRG